MLPILPKGSEMSEVASDTSQAYSLIDDIFGPIREIGRGRVIRTAFDALVRRERRLGERIVRERPRKWTERRVRAIVDHEARRIDAFEIDDLRQIQIEEARHALSQSRSRAANLAAFLAASDPDFHAPDILAQVDVAAGLVGPGATLAGEGEGQAGEGADR